MGLSDWIRSQLDALRTRPPTSPPADARECLTDERDGHLGCRFASHPAHLAAVRKSVERFCVTQTTLDDPAREEVGLVVNEALANVIRHAYAGATDRPVEVTAERHDGPAGTVGVRLLIRDWGNGTDPAALPPKEHDPLTPGGLGMICLYQLMDEVRFDPQPAGGMLLALTRTTPGSRAGLIVDDAAAPAAPSA